MNITGTKKLYNTSAFYEIHCLGSFQRTFPVPKVDYKRTENPT
jgi:hypothetical protein